MRPAISARGPAAIRSTRDTISALEASPGGSPGAGGGAVRTALAVAASIMVISPCRRSGVRSRGLFRVRQADAEGDGVTHGVGHRGVEVGVPDDLVELLAAGVALDQHLDADLLEAHLGRLLLGAAGSPGGGVADIPLQEDLQAAQLDLL